MNINDLKDIIAIDVPINDIRVDHTYLLSEGLIMLKPANNKYAMQSVMAYGFWHWLPEYFFKTPASSTGKYHPAFANGTNGLVLHTLAVMRYVNEFTTFSEMPNETHNELIVAAMFHDMLKYGDPKTYTPGKHTEFEHPLYAMNFFYELNITNDKIIQRIFDTKDSDLSSFRYELITLSRLIGAHMGPWNTNKHSSAILPTPNMCDELLLHKADLIASQKEGDIIKDFLK
jgi:hypothetical protein